MSDWADEKAASLFRKRHFRPTGISTEPHKATEKEVAQALREAKAEGEKIGEARGIERAAEWLQNKWGAGPAARRAIVANQVRALKERP